MGNEFDVVRFTRYCRAAMLSGVSLEKLDCGAGTAVAEALMVEEVLGILVVVVDKKRLRVAARGSASGRRKLRYIGRIVMVEDML